MQQAFWNEMKIIYVCMCVHICSMHVCIYTMHVYVYIYTHVHIYIYTHAHIYHCINHGISKLRISLENRA